GIFIVFGLIFSITESLNNKFIFSSFGKIGIIVTGAIGTFVHELSHLIMCLIFMHKINSVKFFRPIESKNDGILGYVSHSYKKDNLYQSIGNFFIGIAPIIGGTVMIILIFKILLPDSYMKVTQNIDLNLYPEDSYSDLKESIIDYINISGVSKKNLLVGNGSSEIIDLIIHTFVDKDEVILSFSPSFSMYSIYSQINGSKFIGVESDENLVIDIDNVIEKVKENNPKIVIVCNPNNPTGTILKRKDIKKLLDSTNSLVVLDEAYMDFGEESMLSDVFKYDNLIVLRTLSKAFGLAGIRTGYMLSNSSLINSVEKVRPPYNLNSLSDFIATRALRNKDVVKAYIKEVKEERKILYEEMIGMGIKAYKSQANFILFYSEIENLSQKLIDRGVLIRKFGGKLENYYRVTIGDKEENAMFIGAIRDILKKEK
ncbi:histidinol-phosphate transaminase, partial [Clostridioides difficile]|uniref:histidinol-phosphate transaminase n=1 Tax=Clostridioides difficile TaxID=1496 RepID=UPI0020B1CC0E